LKEKYMSEAADNTEDLAPETIDAKPERLPAWKKVRKWIFGAVLLFVISSTVDATVGLISGKKSDSPKQNNQEVASTWIATLRDGNKYVIDNVNALKPFTVAEIYYGYLLVGVPPVPLKSYLPAQPVPEILMKNNIGLIIVFIYRAIPAAIYTLVVVGSSGWISAITGMVALLFGYMALRSISAAKDKRFDWSYLLFVPIVGGVFVWLLIQMMSLAGYVFGGVLTAAETTTVFSILGTTVWAIFKKTENDATDKFIKWSKERIFK
jgi:hypothetical protein